MTYRPSVFLKGSEEMNLTNLSKQELEAFIREATIAAYRAAGWQEKSREC